MTIISFDKPICAKIAAEIEAAAQAVAAKYGITIRRGNAKFDATKIQLQIVATVNDTATLEAAAKKEFEAYCILFDMKPEHFGATFQNGGDSYKVSGLALNRRKFPIKAKNLSTGKELLFTTELVKRLKISAEG